MSTASSNERVMLDPKANVYAKQADQMFHFATKASFESTGMSAALQKNLPDLKDYLTRNGVANVPSFCEPRTSVDVQQVVREAVAHSGNSGGSQVAGVAPDSGGSQGASPGNSP